MPGVILGQHIYTWNNRRSKMSCRQAWAASRWMLRDFGNTLSTSHLAVIGLNAVFTAHFPRDSRLSAIIKDEFCKSDLSPELCAQGSLILWLNVRKPAKVPEHAVTGAKIRGDKTGPVRYDTCPRYQYSFRIITTRQPFFLFSLMSFYTKI